MERIETEEILAARKAVKDAMGGEWLVKKLKKAKENEEKQKQKAEDRKHSYLFETPNHPLIDWWLALERWMDRALASGKADSDPATIQIYSLGDAIIRTRDFPGFDNVARKLRDPKRFYASAFEIEVAAAYEKKGRRVEFIPEESQKTPDLKVHFADGSVLWVECKNREVECERATEAARIGREIYKRVISKLGPAKANCAIAVTVKEDIFWSDVDEIVGLITRLSVAAQNDSVTFEVDPRWISAESAERFEVSVSKIDDADHAQVVDHFILEVDLEALTIGGSEHTSMENGKVSITNPHHFSFLYAPSRDYVTGTVNAFRAARAQLPASGPGAIWIRIPDATWSQKVKDKLDRTEARLQEQLSGDVNRRVNGVVLLTRFYESVEEEGTKGLVYRGVKKLVRHSNPRSRI